MAKSMTQQETLKRLGSYKVVQQHDDGDLTVKSAGKLYVVTTDGRLFEEAPAKEKADKDKCKPCLGSAVKVAIIAAQPEIAPTMSIIPTCPDPMGAKICILGHAVDVGKLNPGAAKLAHMIPARERK